LYKPNVLGVYDLHENVWEWCDDLYDGVPDWVYRCGGWDFNGLSCRAAYRNGYGPGNRYSNLGCRVALVPSGQ
jgi:formylglycine-generating enzyme required for sulfatase activity